jgi:hypothetical protein
MAFLAWQAIMDYSLLLKEIPLNPPFLKGGFFPQTYPSLEN